MEQVALGMFNYISELEPYGIDESCTTKVEVSGADVLFHFESSFLPYNRS